MDDCLPRIKSTTQQPRTCRPSLRQWLMMSELVQPASSIAVLQKKSQFASLLGKRNVVLFVVVVEPIHFRSWRFA